MLDNCKRLHIGETVNIRLADGTEVKGNIVDECHTGYRIRLHHLTNRYKPSVLFSRKDFICRMYVEKKGKYSKYFNSLIGAKIYGN